MWETFKTNINELVNKHIPHKKLSSKPRTPWVTYKTKTLMKKRDRLYKTMKKSGNKDMKDKYKKLKHQVQKELRHSYWKYIENIMTPKADDNNFSSMKKFWTFIKSKKTDHNGVSSLKQEGKLIT